MSGGTLKECAERIARAVEPLPRGAHGQLILTVQHGRVIRVETHETTLTPPPGHLTSSKARD